MYGKVSYTHMQTCDQATSFCLGILKLFVIWNFLALIKQLQLLNHLASVKHRVNVVKLNAEMLDASSKSSELVLKQSKLIVNQSKCGGIFYSSYMDFV